MEIASTADSVNEMVLICSGGDADRFTATWTESFERWRIPNVTNLLALIVQIASRCG